MIIDQFLYSRLKILIVQKRVVKTPNRPGPRFTAVGISKVRKTKSWSDIEQGRMSHLTLGDNKSFEIKNLSSLLPIDRVELNHVNSLDLGCKFRQTSERAKSLFKDA